MNAKVKAVCSSAPVMATAVNEPYLLSSYTLPKRFTQPSSKSFSNVYATYQHASTSTAEGHVIVTAQGDGVHILDVSRHSVRSHVYLEFVILAGHLACG